VHRCVLITALLSAVASTATAQRDSTISPAGLGGVRICAPLATVASRFPSARDTIIESEGEQWPAKLVRLGDGSRILFEASWADTSHVWRITTDSHHYRTRRGWRPGNTLGELRSKGERLEFGYEEGYIVIALVSDQVSFTPDDSTASAFLGRSPRAFDSLHVLPRTARIQDLIVGGDCR